MKRYNISENNDNRMHLRFTPTAVNVCMYRINNTIFITPYLLAKDWRVDTECVLRSPVIKIMRGDDKASFDAFIDHYRYSWNLPQTIYLKDATEFNHKNNDITEIKPPKDINYEVKSRILKAKGVYSDTSSWRRQVKDLLSSLCPIIPEHVQTKESIFIACSWKQKADYSPSDTNAIASKLKEWLDNDIGECVDICIVDTKAGEPIEKEIYSNLNSSTVGIILLTCDVKSNDDKYYAKPNIYHEVGYLMAKYAEKGHDTKVIPIVQSLNGNSVIMPSNISNKAKIDLQDDMIEAIYEKILISLQRLLSLEVIMICNALTSHKNRINEQVLTGKLNNDIAQSWIRTIEATIKKLSYKECDKSNCKDRHQAYINTPMKNILP